MALTSAFISFREIPADLLRLKPQVNAAVVRQLDGRGFALALYEGREMAGVAWMLYDGMYNALYIDTLIIRPEHRSLATLRDAVRIVWAAATGLALALGAGEIVTAVRGLRWMERTLRGHGKRRGELVSYAVGG